MDEEKREFLSEEWLSVFKETLNMNEDYARFAKDWEGDFIFQVDADGGSIAEPIRAYIDLWHGKCREARPARDDDDPEFVYSGTLENWQNLIAGKIGPIKGLMARKFSLKGSYTKVARYVRSANELVKTATAVPTRFPE